MRVCVLRLCVMLEGTFRYHATLYVNPYWTYSTVTELYNGNRLPRGGLINWSLKPFLHKE
jgi:hypothetical protein